jgi:DNA-directed RNA polymerase subunit RPC12/RpoP
MKALGTIFAIAVLAVFSSAPAVGAEGETPASCCGTLFANDAEAAAHMIEHHGKEGCAGCGTIFETQQQKVEHAVEHHGKQGCVQCAKLFENDEEAKGHVCGDGHTH